jgi:S-adenosylmethionine hydrolase
LGPAVQELVRGRLDQPVLAAGELSGWVLTVDHFGNLLTNLDASLVAQVARPVVRAGGQEILVGRTYSDVRPGEYVALINSFGVLEVARAASSAAEGLGLCLATPGLTGRPRRQGNPPRPLRV